MIAIKTIVVHLLKKDLLSAIRSEYSVINQYREINKCLFKIINNNDFIEEIRIYSSVIKILVSSYDRTHLYFVSCGIGSDSIDILDIY